MGGGRDGNIPSSTTNLRQHELDTPYFALVAETVLADDLEFGIAVMRVRMCTVDLSGEQARAQWP